MSEVGDSYTVQHDKEWPLSAMLDLHVPSAEVSLREYLVALTVEEAMDLHASDWGDASTVDATCDAVVQHLVRDDELTVRVGVTVTATRTG